MQVAAREVLLRGVKASRNEPPISYLLFTNDCSLFGEATRRGAQVFKNILHEYRLCSGKRVNFDKSTVLFSKNTMDEDRQIVVNLFGARSSSKPERYLSLSNMVGRRKKEAFQNLKDRLKKRIGNWSTRFLSQCGKEIFIKAILQAIPTYMMACFLLPSSLCIDIESIIAKYWW